MELSISGGCVGHARGVSVLSFVLIPILAFYFPRRDFICSIPLDKGHGVQAFARKEERKETSTI
jgi:hypothetical protein